MNWEDLFHFTTQSSHEIVNVTVFCPPVTVQTFIAQLTRASQRQPDIECYFLSFPHTSWWVAPRRVRSLLNLHLGWKGFAYTTVPGKFRPDSVYYYQTKHFPTHPFSHLVNEDEDNLSKKALGEKCYLDAKHYSEKKKPTSNADVSEVSIFSCF